MTWPFIEGGEPNEEGYNTPEYEDEMVNAVPLSTLFRWYMYDVGIKNPNEFVDVYDLTAVSKEGDEKERQESDVRTDAISDLSPFLNLYANMNADYIFETQRITLVEEQEIDEETLQAQESAIKSFYRNITYAGLVATISAAVELGLLSTSGAYTKID